MPGKMQPRSSSSSPDFEGFFSRDSILRELCKARIKLAKKRSDNLFYYRIASGISQDATRSTRDSSAELNALFPPRRLWHRYRPRPERRYCRSGAGPAAEVDGTSLTLNLQALLSAVHCLGRIRPQPEWATRLEKKIEAIRRRVLESAIFCFEPPRITPVPKDPGGHTYRPIASFTLDDKIIGSLAARYLRELVDPALLPSCWAFRCRRENAGPPTIHDAMNEIVALSRRPWPARMYVAECDIQAFFDCVSHDVARAALKGLITDRNKKRELVPVKVDERAMEIFEAYLRCYSFQISVLGTALGKLQTMDPQAEFRWPRSALLTLHGSEAALVNIGVPQGGAISCLIANAVLHAADKRLDRLRRLWKLKFNYFRYCDDMIILSPWRWMAKVAFGSYTNSAKRLLLPVHAPEKPRPYTGMDKAGFWNGKSRAPYLWGNPRQTRAGYPWVQFVGYQVRYDGLVRIRKKSLARQFARLREECEEILQQLRRGTAAGNNWIISKTKRQILHRFRQKLISLSVGRIRLSNSEGLQPMCWASGFQGLAGQDISLNFLRRLDRYREQQIKRVERYLDKIAKSLPERKQGESKQAKNAHRYYGAPFSYYSQFSTKKLPISLPVKTRPTERQGPRIE